jgi:hypothetical protein
VTIFVADLNDDQWHNVSITVDLTSRQLIVGLRSMRIGRSIADVGMVKQSRDYTMTSFVSLGGKWELDDVRFTYV